MWYTAKMDSQYYYNNFNYLSNKIIPLEFSTKQQEILLLDTNVYIRKITKIKKNYIIITKEEMPLIFYMYYNDPIVDILESK